MLTDVAIRAAEAAEKTHYLPDRDGLRLRVAPSGRKSWEFRYRFDGARKTLSLGPYPEVTLRAARDKVQQHRAELRAGDDPAYLIKQARRRAQTRRDRSFGTVARDWLAKCRREGLAANTIKKRAWLVDQLNRDLADLDVEDLRASDLRRVLDRAVRADTLSTAEELSQTAGQILRYAIVAGYETRDWSQDLRGYVPRKRVKHMPALTDPDDVGDLMLAIERYPSQGTAGMALRISPYLFQRPGEIRHMEWGEISFEEALWRIPGAKMKNGLDHVVPLPRQALGLLQAVQRFRLSPKWVFPGGFNSGKPLSEGGVNSALKRMGYQHRHCAHGFRGTASTLLNEMGWPSDWIERQLAHVEGNSVRRAYNSAQYLDGRRRMMQAWADWLDAARETRRAQGRVLVHAGDAGKVVPLAR